jgi:hypothetical protein
MFAYAPRENDESGRILAGGQIGAASTRADTMTQMGKDIGGALAAIGGMYGKFKDKKDMLAGMDGSVSAMSDMGAVTTDFRDKYMNAPANVRPYLFEAVATPLLQSYQKKQGYADYANAMRGIYGGKAPGADSEMFEF